MQQPVASAGQHIPRFKHVLRQPLQIARHQCLRDASTLSWLLLLLLLTWLLLLLRALLAAASKQVAGQQRLCGCRQAGKCWWRTARLGVVVQQGVVAVTAAGVLLLLLLSNNVSS